MEKEENKFKCLREGCIKGKFARGLCGTCYKYASRLVKQGKLTWKELEKKGKCEIVIARNKNVREEWFLK